MSQLFTKTRREAPADEVSKNAQLLIRAGFIHKEMAGVYSLLPLGLKTFNNIIRVIRQEMNAIGGQEVTLTALQEKSTWDSTNRWNDDVVDVWFKTRLKNNAELGLGFTHEEPLTKLMTAHISSYRDLPCSVYQFQTKFRNETRAKSGIMRCREFIMKDLYSFSRNKIEHEKFYEQVKQAYVNIFNRTGIGERTFLTFASGGSFAQFSHEFQTLTTIGEDTVYVSRQKNIAINQEVYTPEVLEQLGVSPDELVQESAVEVGNIFTLGTRFSEAFELSFKDENGTVAPVFMGSYGIGPGRLMGTIVETLSDVRGIVWPLEVAPFPVHVVQLGSDSLIADAVNSLEIELNKLGLEVFVDDGDASAGEKLADADLMGMPLRIVVSSKSIQSGGYACRLRSGMDDESVRSLPDTLSWVRSQVVYRQ